MNDEHWEKYNDPAPYNKSVRDAEYAYWTQGLESNEWKITHLDLSHIHAQFASAGSGQISSGNVRATGWVFFFQISGKRAQVNGVTLDQKTAFIIGPGDQFTIATETAYDWYSIFVPSALFCDSSQSLHETMAGGTDSRVVTMSPALAQRIAHFEENLEERLTHPPAELQERVIDVSKQLLQLPGRFHLQPGRRPKERLETLKLIVRYIESAPNMNPSVPELSVVSEIPERTLRKVFRDYFGISPSDFVVLRRLHECRKRLQEARGPDTTVTDVATEFAFWDFGRFANRYRSVFGELPSETLARGEISL